MKVFLNGSGLSLLTGTVDRIFFGARLASNNASRRFADVLTGIMNENEVRVAHDTRHRISKAVLLDWNASDFNVGMYLSLPAPLALEHWNTLMTGFNPFKANTLMWLEKPLEPDMWNTSSFAGGISTMSHEDGSFPQVAAFAGKLWVAETHRVDLQEFECPDDPVARLAVTHMMNVYFGNR